MTTLAPWIEQWQHVTSDLREQFWSDLARCTRQLLAFTRSTGESPAAWEGLLQGLYRRGLGGRRSRRSIRGSPISGWVHTLRNLLGAVRRRDHAATCGSFLLV